MQFPWSSEIFQIHLFHLALCYQCPIASLERTAPLAGGCLPPVPLVPQPAEAQDTAELALHNIFNPPSSQAGFQGLAEQGCSHLNVSGGCKKELSSALRRTLLTYIRLVCKHFFFLHFCHEIPVVRPKRESLQLPLKVDNVSSCWVLKTLGQCKDCFTSHVL